MEKISHIVVPINGSPEDDIALSLACLFGKRNKAKVTVIYVVEVRRTLPVDAELPEESDRGQRLLDQAEEDARHLDCALSMDLLQARSAGPAIVDEAGALHADLIIMGLPYHSQFGTYRLGDASNYVLSHATCRVWMVRDRFNPSVESTR
jgi:nucleotide-binding universal stress UspA family protein